MDEYDVKIAMPNEFFGEMKEWLSSGELKSIQHQEFVYCYYWYIAYLWRTTLYANKEIDQKSIKQSLGYNQNEKRIDYIIKKDGLLDVKGYTVASNDYPVSWSLKGEDLSFSMFSDYDEISREYLSSKITGRNIIKAPLKHLGTEVEEGIFWNPQNTHCVSNSIFESCMKNSKLGRSAFYMFGILTSIRDKNRYFSGDDYFKCSNETLSELTSWDIKKITSVTNSMSDVGLISKEQMFKIKGNVNCFEVKC